MSEENKMVRQTSGELDSMIEKASVSVPLSFERIHILLRDNELPWLEKKRLIKLELRGVVQQRKEQLDAILAVERKKIDANVNIADKAIKLYESQLILQVRERFIEMAKGLGQRVEMNQLAFLKDFGEQITQSEKNLETREIDEKYKQVIRAAHNKAFNRLLTNLESLTDRIIQSAQETGKKE